MGEIITFYSYKGGTGRTMSLANVGVLLAQRPNTKVLLMDWDLEAPGLHYYFNDYCEEQINNKRGIIDFFRKAKREKIYEEDSVADFCEKKLRKYITPLTLPDVDNPLYIMGSGQMDQTYTNKIHDFKWRSFFKKSPYFFTTFARYLSSHFDYVLIDARTGRTDIGGICTCLMPEKLVLVFTPNRQSLEGIIRTAHNTTTYRLKSPDLRPLMIYPLPSRIDVEEEELRLKWKQKYEKTFTEAYKEIYGLSDTINTNKYFNEVIVRHSSKLAYEEEISVLSDDKGLYSLFESYKNFVVWLTNIGKPWEYEAISSSENPKSLEIIYDGYDKPIIDDLYRHLQTLSRQKIISFEKIPPFQQWDEVNKRKVALGKYDILLQFNRRNLEQNDLLDYIKEAETRGSHLIRLDVSDNFFEGESKEQELLQLTESIGDQIATHFHDIGKSSQNFQSKLKHG